MVWTPVQHAWRVLMHRNILTWIFEKLPVYLAILQCVAAVCAGGDVDGWSRGPLAKVGDISRAAAGSLGAFMGRWNLQEHQNMDGFLEALGFPPWQRALISRAGQQYTLEAINGKNGDALRIVTSDLRGRNELELPLSGDPVTADDGDDGARVCRRLARLDRKTVLVTEHFPGEAHPFSECRRTLQPDGRMRIDVKKRTRSGQTVAMQAFAAKA
jgi:hypothetical protein